MGIKPFLKWAGGKRWLIANYQALFNIEFDRYIEPFLGGGSIFFGLKPQQAILSDVNADLIDCYSAIRNDHTRIEELLEFHHAKHSKEYYYKIRSTCFADPLESAAKFLYLNRTCFNGLYRVNLRGEFNVPIGTKSSVVMPDDNFAATSELLRRADLRCCDFAKTLSEAGEGDFAYVDPPYTANHNHNGFLKYNERIFSWADQVRLKENVVAAAKRGARIVVSNAAHQSIIDLYGDVGNTSLVDRASVLAASRSKRGRVEELLITL